MVPSRNAVIVRMGWTFNDSDAFDSCQFVSDELKTLEQGDPAPGALTPIRWPHD